MKSKFLLICILSGFFLINASAQNRLTEIGKSPVSFNMFPNPAIDQVSITVNGVSVEQAVELRLYNAVGDEVLSRKILPEESGSPVTIDLNPFQRGMYVVQISASDKMITKKLLLK